MNKRIFLALSLLFVAASMSGMLYDASGKPFYPGVPAGFNPNEPMSRAGFLSANHPQNYRLSNGKYLTVGWDYKDEKPYARFDVFSANGAYEDTYLEPIKFEEKQEVIDKLIEKYKMLLNK